MWDCAILAPVGGGLMFRFPKTIEDLRRRNIFRVAVGYLVIAWLLVQIADILLDTFAAPAWAMRTIVIVLVAGVPVTLVIAWVYDLTHHEPKEPDQESGGAPTPSGFGRQVDFIIMGILVLAVALFAADRFKWVDFGPAPATGPVSLAVLPLKDISMAGDQDWLSDGLTEEILNSLAGLPQLRVIARTSAFHFKDEDVSLDQIADMLDVEYTVEGSIRRIDNDLRLTVKLIRNSDGVQIWSNVYNRSTNDILQVQTEVAESIANALNVVLDADQREFMFVTGTQSVEAFEAFLRGRAIFDAVHRGDRSNTLWIANELFEEALAFDSTYAAAHYMHHDAYPHYLMSEGADPMAPAGPGLDLTEAEAVSRMRTDLENAIANARDASLKASMEIDHTVMLQSWHRLPELFLDLSDSAQIGRSETRLLGWTDLVLTTLGHAETTLLRANNNLKTDPYEPLNWINSATASLSLNRPQDAISYLRRGRRLVGDHEFMNRVEAMAHLMLGDVELAAQFYMKEDTLVALAHALLGQDEEARRIAAEIEARNPRQEELILTYAALGDEENVDRLTRRIDSSTIGSLQLLRAMLYVAGRVPFNLREAPNFRKRLLEAGIEPHSLETWSIEASTLH